MHLRHSRRNQTHSPGAPSPPQPSSEPPGAHSQACTSSRKSAFCVRSRCRSCRKMWRFQRAAGNPVPQGPAMAARSRLPHAHPGPKKALVGWGGTSRGLRDVMGGPRVGGGGESPDCTKSVLGGENKMQTLVGSRTRVYTRGTPKNSHLSWSSYCCLGR